MKTAIAVAAADVIRRTIPITIPNHTRFLSDEACISNSIYFFELTLLNFLFLF